MRPWYRRLGHLLRALRLGRRWSLRRAVHEARRLGTPVDRALLRRIEAGATVPGRVVLRRLALLYAVPAGELEEEAFLAAALRPPAPLPPGSDPVAAMERDLSRCRHLAVLARAERLEEEGWPGKTASRALFLRAAAARALGLAGVSRRALEEAAGAPGPGRARLDACWWLVDEALGRGEARHALLLLALAEDDVRACGDPATLALHRAREGAARLAVGRRVTGLRLLDEARDLARRSGNPAVLGAVISRRARAVAPRDGEVARALAGEALREAQRSGDRRAIVRRLLDLAALPPGSDPAAGEARRKAVADAIELARAARLPVEEFLALDAALRMGPELFPVPDAVLRRRRDALLSRLSRPPLAALYRREEILAEARQRAAAEERWAGFPARAARGEVPCAS